MPEGHQYDGTKKGLNNWNAINNRITANVELYNIREQPDADERCDNRSYEAKWKPPTINKLRD